MNWKDYVLAPLRAGWGKLVSWSKFLANQTIDPPPARAKAYFWVAVAMLAFGWLAGATVVSGVKSFFVPVYQAAKPMPLIPRLPSVITTVPLPTPAAVETLPPLAKVIKPEELTPKVNSGVNPTVIDAKPASNKRIIRRKRKCDTVFC